jgi:hypothetical protein
MWVRGTFCLRKLDHNWLIVHDQASVPLDIASGKGVTDLEPDEAQKCPCATPDRAGT